MRNMLKEPAQAQAQADAASYQGKAAQRCTKGLIRPDQMPGQLYAREELESDEKTRHGCSSRTGSVTCRLLISIVMPHTLR